MEGTKYLVTVREIRNWTPSITHEAKNGDEESDVCSDFGQADELNVEEG